VTTTAAVSISALLPEHLADLRRSGLSDETIAAARIRSLPRHRWSAYLSDPMRLALEKVSGSAMSFPFACPESFPVTRRMYKIKLFPPLRLAAGDPLTRYYQPAGTGARLYLPGRARAALTDVSVPLWFVEGEKKALAGDQAGLACVGLGIGWCWQTKRADGPSVPSPDLDLIDLRRAVSLVPDADTWTRPLPKQGVYAFGRELLDHRGATSVMIVKLPRTHHGLDDYLADVGTLDALDRVNLSAVIARLTV
jgi:hypothetical protein